ncbi:MAG: hypothetical protein GQ574_19170 [Crocinitomix sp.]|nr:hypothetical protein [Crocinitomix sp.]
MKYFLFLFLTVTLFTQCRKDVDYTNTGQTNMEEPDEKLLWTQHILIKGHAKLSGCGDPAENIILNYGRDHHGFMGSVTTNSYGYYEVNFIDSIYLNPDQAMHPSYYWVNTSKNAEQPYDFITNYSPSATTPHTSTYNQDIIDFTISNLNKATLHVELVGASDHHYAEFNQCNVYDHWADTCLVYQRDSLSLYRYGAGYVYFDYKVVHDLDTTLWRDSIYTSCGTNVATINR